jgi:S1-C subfamily serine protease
MTELFKVSEKEPAEVAYYDGYQRGHNDTAKMLARRSLVYLFLGGFMGVGLFFLAMHTGVIDRLRADPVVEDPALEQQKPKEFVNAINWAKRFTVGIIAKTPDSRTRSGAMRIPGQSYVGSGIVLNEQGYVLTNFHVIPSNVGELSVVLGDDIYEARFVGGRREYDLAVLKIKADKLVPASLGDSDKAEQGDVVVAIGSPHGLFHSATEGIVSYVARRNNMSGSAVRDYIQTSAAINPGNSGGPLVDLTGRVIGINTLKIAGEGGEATDGIGFAIPINLARRVSENIIASDDTSKDDRISSRSRPLQSAILGVEIDRSAFRPESAPGALIVRVVEDSAAEKAGLKAGDRITNFGGTEISSFEALQTAVKSMRGGDKVSITYAREGESHTVEVTLGD